MIIKINGKPINDIKKPIKEVKIERPKYNLYNPNMFYGFATVSPMALVDTKAILIGAGIIVIAFLEKKLADYGFISIAEIIYKSMNIILAGTGCTAAFYLIAKSMEMFL